MDAAEGPTFIILGMWHDAPGVEVLFMTKTKSLADAVLQAIERAQPMLKIEMRQVTEHHASWR